MFSRINNNFTVFIVFIISFIAIASAIVLERFFNFAPCYLCRVQQIVYALLLLLSASVLFTNMTSKRVKCFSHIVIVILIISNIIVAGYQSLVQMGVIDPYFKCTKKAMISTSNVNNNEDDIATRLLHYRKTIAKQSPSKECYQADDKIFGFTLAQYNFVISLFLLFIMIGGWFCRAKCKKVEK